MREHPVLTKVKRRLKDMEAKLCDESSTVLDFDELEELDKLRAQIDVMKWVVALFKD